MQFAEKDEQVLTKVNEAKNKARELSKRIRKLTTPTMLLSVLTRGEKEKLEEVIDTLDFTINPSCYCQNCIAGMGEEYGCYWGAD